MAKIRIYWDRVATSLWFLPAAMVVGASLLAYFALQMQWSRYVGDEGVWWLHSGGATDASELMSTLLGSLFTMTTLVISITMVVLTLAAQTLGPRLLRSFMSDRRTQAILGLFIATIVYLLLVLRTIHGELDGKAVPHTAVTVGSALALVCIFALIYYVHHLARSIVTDVVVQRVGAKLDEAIRTLLPEARPEPPERLPRPPLTGPPGSFGLPAGGYVQAIDSDALVRIATEADVRIEVSFRAGHHILPFAAAVDVHPAAALTPELEDGIAGAIVIGNERTPTQDLEFAVAHLVEIALRALSPSINDPFTAIAVIDRLALSLTAVMRRVPPPVEHRDAEGTIRVTIQVSGFRGLMDAGFNQIRQAAAMRADVLIRLLETLEALANVARDRGHLDPILLHARLVRDAARRNLREPYDLNAVERVYERLAPSNRLVAAPEASASG